MTKRHILSSLVLALVLTLPLALAWTPGLGIAAEARSLTTRHQSPAYTSILYHPTFPKSFFGHTSTLHLQNPSSEAATFQLEFRALDTQDTYTIDGTIAPMGKLVIPAESTPELPGEAQYSLVVSSDQPVESVVTMHRSVPQGDELASYRGVSSGSDELHFGPFHKNWAADTTLVNSALVIWNIGQSTANFHVYYLALDGSLVTSAYMSLGPQQQVSLVGLSEDELPDDFRGWVRVSSDEPVVGLLNHFDSSGEVFQVYEPLSCGPSPGFAFTSFLPRALKGVDEGNGPRTTSLFVGNRGVDEAHAVLDFYEADGTLPLSYEFSLPPAGATAFSMDELQQLPSNRVWAVILRSDQPLVMGEMYYDESARVSAGTYGSKAADTLSLPHIARTDNAHTVLSVQNTGSTETFISVSYLDVSGTRIYSQETTLPPGGLVRYDQSQMPQLGDHFEGSAVIEATGPVKALVDEYAPPPQHVLDVAIVGEGDVDVDPEQDEYAHGDVVTLTPSANLGWTFDDWSGPDAGDLSDNGDGTWTLVMDDDKSVTATFTQDEYSLDVTIVGQGNVEVEPDQDVYHHGDVVTLTATAQPGWTFAAWSGTVNSTNLPLEITVEGDTVITATFTQDEYTLDVTIVGEGDVDIEPEQDTYLYGDEVLLTATAHPDWTFAGWSGDVDSTANPLELTIEGDTTVTATFEARETKVYLPLVLTNN